MTTQEATMTARRRRRLEQNLQKEARWLQKTIFSLRKAQDARSKISDTSGTQLTPLVSVEDTQISISDIETLIDERVDEIRTELGVGAYQSI
jgi:predicted  nucleic acid-binding Zn-ribbon protein